MRIVGLGLILVVFSFVQELGAATISESFATRSRRLGGSAIWNQSIGRVHPSLYLTNFKAGFTPRSIDVGDGSDGPFDSTTYAQFGTVVGSDIIIDTTVHPVLNVTRFELDAGLFLKPIGGAPLIIHSLGDVIVNGEIWCHGNAGASSSGATPGAGGSGRCGGANGGNGGTPTQAGSAGGNSNGTVTGGRGGNYVAASFVGGGGGGSWSANAPLPTDGPNSSASGGEAGLHSSDPEFLNDLGGAGGGGGSGGDTTAGGGGGGGGGTVIIHAVGDFVMGAGGYIFVNGGAGGDADTLASEAGPGGGGGAGSVQVFTAGTLNIQNFDGLGASQGYGGIGGTNSVAAVGADGGQGRSWFGAGTFGGGGIYYPSEEAPINQGDVEYNTNPESMTTTSFDLGSTTASLSNLNLVSLNANVTLEVAGSSDDFVSDTTGFTTNLALVANKRFIRFRMNFVNVDPFNPAMVDLVSLDYDQGEKSDFRFEAGGCGRVNGSSAPPHGWILFIPFLLFAILKFQTQRKRA